MSRKSKLGPPVLRVESLSTGAQTQAVIMDDFSGQRIEPMREAPKGEIINPIAEQKQQVKDDKALALAALMPQHAPDSALRRLNALHKAMPTLAANQRKLGEFVISFPDKPWRR